MTPLRDFFDTLERIGENPGSYAAIFDVDGTLADVSELRQKWLYSEDHGKDFQEFHAASVDAPVIEWVREAAVLAHGRGLAVIIVTGRTSRWRGHTAWWLALNEIPSDALYMRGAKDHRPDALVKADILERIKASWSPVWAFDDNPSTIAVWVHAGIPVTVVPGWVDK